VEIGALDGITIGGSILVNGGDGGTFSANGGGSGGGILLHGETVTHTGTLFAQGGGGGSSGGVGNGGGSGGRVVILTTCGGFTNAGGINVSGGHSVSGGAASQPGVVTMTVTPIAALIDIKPGTSPNHISLNSRGLLPVAVLTTSDLDATTIDPTIAFGDPALTGRVAPVKSRVEDVDRDGDVNVVVFFSLPQIKLAGALDGNSVVAELTGETVEGCPFIDRDSVTLMP
jgi:hypothetical protein